MVKTSTAEKETPGPYDHYELSDFDVKGLSNPWMQSSPGREWQAAKQRAEQKKRAELVESLAKSRLDQKIDCESKSESLKKFEDELNRQIPIQTRLARDLDTSRSVLAGTQAKWLEAVGKIEFALRALMTAEVKVFLEEIETLIQRIQNSGDRYSPPGLSEVLADLMKLRGEAAELPFLAVPQAEEAISRMRPRLTLARGKIAQFTPDTSAALLAVGF